MNTISRVLVRLRNLMASPPPQPPVFVVMGATGTGKTKLGIELAQRYNGEVINVDAIQMYAGLDVATNKASKEEMAGVQHHLLGFLDPLRDDFTVRQFQTAAIDLIDKIRSRGRSPVLVGGTHYYIESVLYRFLTPIDSSSASPLSKPSDRNSTLDNAALHARLAEVDPESAARIHPNDRRKVLNALDVAALTGVPLSAHLAAQTAHVRYPGSVVAFWADTAQLELDQRLSKRVDAMMEAGLLRELQTFHREYNEARGGGYEVGIWQAIGFKEFLPFLQLPADRQEGEEGKEAMKECVERLQIATRQLARRQLKWIVNRFLRRGGTGLEVVPVFRVDTTRPDAWTEEVSRTVGRVVEGWRSAEGREEWWKEAGVVPERRGPKERQTETVRHCEACEGRRFQGEEDWQIHLKSRKHQKRMASIRKRERRKALEAVKS